MNHRASNNNPLSVFVHARGRRKHGREIGLKAELTSQMKFMKTLVLFLVIGIGVLLPPPATAVTVDNFVARTYTNSSGVLPYRLFIPTNYTPSVKYPLVLFLHGSGERGSDNRLQLTGQTAPLVFADTPNQTKHPSFMVAPQCPLDGAWNDSIREGQVLEMMNALMAQYSIEADRVYVTGLSMGGFGTWDYITLYPQMYAAAVPISSYYWNLSLAAVAGQTPIWNFCGALDSYASSSVRRWRPCGRLAATSSTPNTPTAGTLSGVTHTARQS